MLFESLKKYFENTPQEILDKDREEVEYLNEVAPYIEFPKTVLQLAVKEPWFSMIASGEKKEEYREIKDYWTKRFNGNKIYTHVLFVNGYGANRPRVEKEIEDICVGKPKEGWCPSEFLDNEYYIIKLK